MSRENEMVIAMKNVRKIYNMGETGYWALRGIDLEITKGEFIAIVGKSGSGKSTLLNILGGIDKASEGSITIIGRKINDFSENQLARLRSESIGFVFQFFQLMPTLTVKENVMLPMDFSLKIPFSKRKERANMLLAKVGILNQAEKFPAELSGGEQQRVAIARALANDPQIILADEPTGNLDSKTSDDIFNLLEGLTLEGKNVIMVTHNEELAARCQRIIRIQDGFIMQDVVADNGRG